MIKINKKNAAFKLISIFICLVSLFNFLYRVYAVDNVFSWYCKRTNDHSQPPLPKEFDFIKEHNGYFIDPKNSDYDSSDKVVYLTFDAGYENGNIEKILNVLKDNDVIGAFFILSNLIKTCPELVKRMGEEGHLVCNHTSKHKDMSKISDKDVFRSEIETLEQEYKDLTGKELSKYFRPPEGKFSKTTLSYASELGYKTVFWSFAYADWDNSSQMPDRAAKEKILSNIHNGEVMLLHPTSSTNASIMDNIIKELKIEGYRFGTLDELVANNQ